MYEVIRFFGLRREYSIKGHFHGYTIEGGNLRLLVYPKGIQRLPPPKEVASEFANDYIEACLVLSDSPKASAALSRRCLQDILREKAIIQNSALANEIQQVIDSR